MKKPILFANFNRPHCTAKSFAQIRRYKPERLYISIDGPRKHVYQDKEHVNKVKKIVAEIDWDCDVRRWYSETNQGCKTAIQKSLDRFFAVEEEGIILEDDCVPSSAFFKFTEKLLDKYRFDERIAVIHGNSVGFRSKTAQATSSYFFSQFMNMWGWATWRRTYQLIDKEMTIWRAFDNKSLFLDRLLQFYGSQKDYKWIEYWKHQFSKVADNEGEIWDFQWIFNIIEKQKLCIVPTVNLVENIGWGPGATNTHATDLSICNIPIEKMSFPLKHPDISTLQVNYDYEAHIKTEWCGVR